MIKLNKSKSVKNNQTVIFLADDISKINQLSKEQATYFKKDFKKEKVQYTKSNIYTYVVNTKKQSAEELRIEAFNIHKNIKGNKEITVVGENKKDTLAFLEGLLLSNYQF